MTGSQDGARWFDSSGTSHTVNSTSDPAVPAGGYYYTQTATQQPFTTPMERLLT